MKKLNKYSIFNISLFVAWTFLYLFEIVKFIIYSTHRELGWADISQIGGGGERLLIFIFWIIFSLFYENKDKFRKTSLVFQILCAFISIGLLIRKAIDFPNLFFATSYYTPPFIDRFTSIFELCFISVYTLIFVYYLIHLIIKRHFKKLS